MMKRIIAILAAVMLLALISVPAMAEGSANFYLEGPSTAKVGDRITVSVMIEGEYEAHMLNMRVFFDNTSFRFVSKSMGAVFTNAQADGGYGMCEVNTEGNAVSIGLMMPTDPMHGSGELAKLTFEVLGTASPNSQFGIEIEEFASLPITATIAENIECTSGTLNISITGGSGSGTTEIPINTPKPAGTDAPVNPRNTPNPPNPTNQANPSQAAKTTSPDTTQGSAGRETPPPDQSQSPENTNALVPIDPSQGVSDETPTPVSESELAPVDTDRPTEQPGGETEPGQRSNTKPLLIVGGAVLAAAVVAIVALAIARSAKRKKDER